MPKLDGTGPRGEGPKTGRGLGNCDKTNTNETTNDTKRPRGLGQGQGRAQAGNRRNSNRDQK